MAYIVPFVSSLQVAPGARGDSISDVSHSLPCPSPPLPLLEREFPPRSIMQTQSVRVAACSAAAGPYPVCPRRSPCADVVVPETFYAMRPTTLRVARPLAALCVVSIYWVHGANQALRIPPVLFPCYEQRHVLSRYCNVYENESSTPGATL